MLKVKNVALTLTLTFISVLPCYAFSGVPNGVSSESAVSDASCPKKTMFSERCVASGVTDSAYCDLHKERDALQDIFVSRVENQKTIRTMRYFSENLNRLNSVAREAAFGNLDAFDDLPGLYKDVSSYWEKVERSDFINKNPILYSRLKSRWEKIEENVEKINENVSSIHDLYGVYDSLEMGISDLHKDYQAFNNDLIDMEVMGATMAQALTISDMSIKLGRLSDALSGMRYLGDSHHDYYFDALSMTKNILTHIRKHADREKMVSVIFPEYPPITENNKISFEMVEIGFAEVYSMVVEFRNNYPALLAARKSAKNIVSSSRDIQEYLFEIENYLNEDQESAEAEILKIMGNDTSNEPP